MSMAGKITLVIILACLVAGVYFLGITGFFFFGERAPDDVREESGAGERGPIFSIKGPGGGEKTEIPQESGEEEGPAGEPEETEPVEEPEHEQQLTGGGGGGGSGSGGGSPPPQPACFKDSDCGTDSWEDPYCIDSDVYQDKTKHTCANPGIPSASCSSLRTPELKEECEVCYEGECIDAVKVFVDPSENEVSAGENFALNVNINTNYSVFAVQFELYFDSNVLEVLNATEGGFLRKDNASTYPVIEFDNAEGRVVFANTRFDIQTGVEGSGTLGSMEFYAKSPGSSDLELEYVIVTDPDIEEIPSSAGNGNVDVVS